MVKRETSSENDEYVKENTDSEYDDCGEYCPDIDGDIDPCDVKETIYDLDSGHCKHENLKKLDYSDQSKSKPCCLAYGYLHLDNCEV